MYVADQQRPIVTKFINARRRSPNRCSKPRYLDSIRELDGEPVAAHSAAFLPLSDTPWQRVLRDRSIVQRLWIFRPWNRRLAFSVLYLLSRLTSHGSKHQCVRHVRGSIWSTEVHREFQAIERLARGYKEPLNSPELSVFISWARVTLPIKNTFFVLRSCSIDQRGTVARYDGNRKDELDDPRFITRL